MNPVHVHLLLNHIPILGTLFGVLLLAFGLIKKSNHLINASIVTFVIAALATIPVFLTGEPAEEAVENLSGVVVAAIEEHEEAAETALWLMEVLGVFSIITMFLRIKNHALSFYATIFLFVLALGVFGLMAKVGNDGGRIRHPETSSTTTVNGGSAQESGVEVEKGED